MSQGVTTTSQSCVYVLSDGQRFRCPGALSRTLRTLSSLEHTKACVQLSKLVVPAATQAVSAAIERARTCLKVQHLSVTGGPVVPAQGPNKPNGELIVGNGYPEAFVAFYENSAVAQRKEPTILRRAKRLGGEVERHGAVTVIWVRPPQPQLRQSLQACGLG
jgi:hypothetical protein